MAIEPIVIPQSKPNPKNTKQVRLDQTEFNNLVWDKGTSVFIEKAMRCPCKTDGSSSLGSCLNCGGSQWFFIQKRTTQVVLQSAKLEWNFKEWSEEDYGNIKMTMLARDEPTIMDRITVLEAISIYTDVVHLKYSEKSDMLFGYTPYAVLKIKEAFLFNDPKKAHIRLIPDENIFFEGNMISVSKELFKSNNPRISIRYEHNPQYHILDVKREFITQPSIEVGSNGSAIDKKFPQLAFARKAHYFFDQQNYFANCDKPLWLIDNSYSPPPACEHQNNQDGTNSCGCT